MNASNEQRVIAITLGDPAGIGPEVILKALVTPDITPLARWVIVGDRPTIERTSREIGIPLDGANATIHHVDALNGHVVANGEMHAASGAAAVAYVKEATEQCLRGDADAMVTAPISKEAVALGGTHFSGHTEY